MPEAKIALITGASSGIGAALANLLGRKGMRLVLVARRSERLENLAREIDRQGRSVLTLKADLCLKSERARVFDMVMERFGRVDILVNNAGIGWYGYASDMPWEIANELLQLNIIAVAHLTLLLLPEMRRRNIGYIINIGSISGSLPSQGVALYGASKSFLDNFTIALSRELRGTQLQASVVRAGPVHSEFCEAAVSRLGGLPMPTERLGVTPEHVASRIWRLIKDPQQTIYLPRRLAITPWVEKCFGWLIDRLGPLLLRYHTANSGYLHKSLD